MSTFINIDTMTINGKPMNEEQRKAAETLKENFEDIFNDNEDEEDGI